MNSIQKEIDLMYKRLAKDHQQNINQEVFSDIAKVFLDIKEHYLSELDKYIKHKKDGIKYEPNLLKYVCDASMGHGKTSVLTTYLSTLLRSIYLGDEPFYSRIKRIPILLCVREKYVAEQIKDDLSDFGDNVLYITADNKEFAMDFIPKAQVVIITHSRLKNLALEYGYIDFWKTWHNEIDGKIFKRHRICIIDEMPEFVNSTIWGIDNKNNCLDWFDKLANKIDDIDSKSAQKIKSFIMGLFSLELSVNDTDKTNALYDIIADSHGRIMKNNTEDLLIKMREQFIEPELSQRIEHLQKLLTIKGFGKIDEYKGMGLGRQIIVSEFINYRKLDMNILVLDGTAEIQWEWYNKAGFELKHIDNRNDYKRLTIQQEDINTSLYCRQNKEHTVQTAIAHDILMFRKLYPQMFVLPCKSDIKTYNSLGSILPQHKKFFDYNINDDNQLPLNLLNTTGKNDLQYMTEMYITSLPIMNVNFYKCQALALYGYDIDLQLNDEKNSTQWFADYRVESTYKNYIYMELIQIIHRTKLRHIACNDSIKIFIACHTNKDVPSIVDELKEIYFAECNTSYAQVNNISDYKVDKNTQESINNLLSYIKKEKKFPISLRKIGKTERIGIKLANTLKQKNRYEERITFINDLLTPNNFEMYRTADNTIMIRKYKALEDNLIELFG